MLPVVPIGSTLTFGSVRALGLPTICIERALFIFKFERALLDSKNPGTTWPFLRFWERL